MSSSQPLEQEYAGQRLGLPEDGPGSVAGWGRRVAALFVDWFGSWFVTLAILGLSGAEGDSRRSLELVLPTAVLLTEMTLFTALIGASFGQGALRIVVARLDGRRVTLLQALVRSFLICLVIPPLVFNRDNRGLHDLAVGTVALRR